MFIIQNYCPWSLCRALDFQHVCLCKLQVCTVKWHLSYSPPPVPGNYFSLNSVPPDSKNVIFIALAFQGHFGMHSEIQSQHLWNGFACSNPRLKTGYVTLLYAPFWKSADDPFNRTTWVFQRALGSPLKCPGMRTYFTIQIIGTYLDTSYTVNI